MESDYQTFQNSEKNETDRQLKDFDQELKRIIKEADNYRKQIETEMK